MTYLQILKICILCLTVVFTAQSQGNYFQIQSIDGKKTVTVKNGNFVQCIQSVTDSTKVFSFGKVRRISNDGILLENNSFLPGSGGFVSFRNIRNIEKISIIKRSILPACIGGYIVGQLMVIESLPKAIGPIAGGIVTAFTLIRAIKHQKKTLFRNTVNQSIILITPSNRENKNVYFE